MQHTRRIVIALSLVGAVAASVTAGYALGEYKNRRAGEISYEDRAQIMDLIVADSVYFDNRVGEKGAEAWASLYTPDGALVFPSPQAPTGHDQLVAFASRARPDSKRQGIHFTGIPLLVQVGPDEVHARTPLFLAGQERDKPDSAKFGGFGYYDDVIVRTKDGWKFKRHEGSDGGPLPPELLP